jgi:membrane-bound serine protease (ClpP class)
VSGREEMINATGEVLDAAGGQAYARIHGETWQVRANVALARGQRVRVVGIDGLVLAVEPITAGPVEGAAT